MSNERSPAIKVGTSGRVHHQQSGCPGPAAPCAGAGNAATRYTQRRRLRQGRDPQLRVVQQVLPRDRADVLVLDVSGQGLGGVGAHDPAHRLGDVLVVVVAAGRPHPLQAGHRRQPQVARQVLGVPDDDRPGVGAGVLAEQVVGELKGDGGVVEDGERGPRGVEQPSG